MKTIISGASDDLIEIDGLISDETEADFNTKTGMIKITASDGTLAYMDFTGGCWNIHLDDFGDSFEKLVPSNGEDTPHTDEDLIKHNVPNYSDAIVFDKPLEWVKINNKKFKPK